MESKPHADPQDLLAHADWLRRLARSLVGEGEAEDLIQDTWVAALRRPPRTGAAARPFLARVLANLSVNRRRGAGRRRERETAVAEESEMRGHGPVDPATIAEEVEGQRRLLDAVARLDEPFRTTVVLRYFRGMDSADIARREGVPAGTVRWRSKRALELLRERLDASLGSRGAWVGLLLPYALPTGAQALPVGMGAAKAGIEAGSKGAGAFAQGVLVMQGLKLGLVVAVTAVCGLALWQLRKTPEGGDTAAIEVSARSSSADSDADEPLLPASAVQEAAADRAAVATEPGPEVEPSLAGETAAPPLPARVLARFVDEAGLPVAGVRVTALERDERAREVSGADGRVEFAVHRALPQPRGWSQEFRAERAGFATVSLTATLTEGAAAHLGDVVLAPGSVVYGRVVTPDGRGVAGALVRTSTAPAPEREDDSERELRYGPEGWDGPTVASNDDGSFALAGVPPGPQRLWAKAAGTRFAQSAEFTVVLGEDMYGVDLTLEPWHRADHIRGRVVGPDGEPVGGAGIAYSMRGEGRGFSSSLSADAGGTFELLIPYSGAYRFTASDPEKRWADGVARDVRPGAEIVIELAEIHWIEVTAATLDGEPIERFAVKVENVDGTYAHWDPLGDRPGGTARMSAPPEEFQVTLEAPGYASASRGPFGSGAVPDRLDFTLERAPCLIGRVLASGKPIAGARVELRDSHRTTDVVCNGFPILMESHGSASDTSGEDGSFELPIAESGEFFVYAKADGWVGVFTGPLRLEAGMAPAAIELSLAEGGTIEGRVLVAEGKQAAGVIVGASCGDGLGRTQRAGPGGSFRFEGLTPGMWQVVRRDAEIDPNSSTTSYAGSRSEPIQWDCEVFDGRVTWFDLDLTGDL